MKEQIPPNHKDVAIYCKERKNGIDAQGFIDFYEAGGWFRGKTKIKSWKACIRTWERNRKETSNTPPQPYRNSNPLGIVALGKQKNITARPGESMEAYEQRLLQTR